MGWKKSNPNYVFTNSEFVYLLNLLWYLRLINKFLLPWESFILILLICFTKGEISIVG